MVSRREASPAPVPPPLDASVASAALPDVGARVDLAPPAAKERRFLTPPPPASVPAPRAREASSPAPSLPPFTPPPPHLAESTAELRALRVLADVDAALEGAEPDTDVTIVAEHEVTVVSDLAGLAREAHAEAKSPATVAAPARRPSVPRVATRRPPPVPLDASILAVPRPSITDEDRPTYLVPPPPRVPTDLVGSVAPPYAFRGLVEQATPASGAPSSAAPFAVAASIRPPASGRLALATLPARRRTPTAALVGAAAALAVAVAGAAHLGLAGDGGAPDTARAEGSEEAPPRAAAAAHLAPPAPERPAAAPPAVPALPSPAERAAPVAAAPAAPPRTSPPGEPSRTPPPAERPTAALAPRAPAAKPAEPSVPSAPVAKVTAPTPAAPALPAWEPPTKARPRSETRREPTPPKPAAAPPKPAAKAPAKTPTAPGATKEQLDAFQAQQLDAKF